jgi:hypothetical protein
VFVKKGVVLGDLNENLFHIKFGTAVQDSPFPAFDAIKPEHVVPGISALLADVILSMI